MSPVSMATVGASSKPGTAAWKPTDLGTPLHVWFDADDATTFTEVSGLVSQWNDKSGNGRNATQTTSTRRPARTASTLNGKAAVVFTTDLLLFSTSGLSQPYGWFLVLRQYTTSTSNFARPVHSSNGTGSLEAFLNYYSLYHGSTLQRGVSSSTDPRILYALYNSSTSLLRQDGTQQSTTGNTGTAATTTSWSLGAGTAFDRNLDGYIAEFFLVTGSMATTDIEKSEGYLAHKWGLTANLPSGHPYKSVAP